MSGQRSRLNDDLIRRALMARAAEPDISLLDEILRAAASVPQARRSAWSAGPAVPRVVLVAATLLLLAALGGAIAVGSGVIRIPGLPLPGGQGGEITYANEASLIAIDPESGAERTVFECGDSCDVIEFAAWSPDGTRVAYFASYEPLSSTRPRELRVVDLESTASRTLALCERPCFATSIAWSPDGTRIAWVEGHNPVGLNLPGGEVHVVDVSGGIDSVLTDSGGMVQRMTWSPGGDRIAYATQLSGVLRRVEIHVMAADGNDRTLISEDDFSDTALDLAWSPDGSVIAYVHGDETAGTYEVRTVRPDGSLRTTIFDGARCCETPSAISWSPDGSRLLLAADGLWVMNADGSDARRVASQTPEDRPGWRPTH